MTVLVMNAMAAPLIEPDAAHPSYIQTVWGFGYVFVPDGEKPRS